MLFSSDAEVSMHEIQVCLLPSQLYVLSHFRTTVPDSGLRSGQTDRQTDRRADEQKDGGQKKATGSGLSVVELCGQYASAADVTEGEDNVTDRQADRHAGRQTCRQKDRQTAGRQAGRNT